MFVEEVSLPTTATVVGASVDVVGIDIAGHGEELTARCRRGNVEQSLRLSELVFAPDTAAGWLHAAYRRCLGLVPHPASDPGRMAAVLVVTVTLVAAGAVPRPAPVAT